MLVSYLGPVRMLHRVYHDPTYVWCTYGSVTRELVVSLAYRGVQFGMAAQPRK